jgi:hypothetical protein
MLPKSSHRPSFVRDNAQRKVGELTQAFYELQIKPSDGSSTIFAQTENVSNRHPDEEGAAINLTAPFNHLCEHEQPRTYHVARRNRPAHQNQPDADDSEKARHGSPVPQSPAVNLSLVNA